MRQRERTVTTTDERVAEPSHDRSDWLRIFQFISAAAGAVLFIIGLIAAFRVDFSADLLDNSAVVAGFGFSAVGAIAGILFGGAILATALGDQDRGLSGFIGLLTLLAGIAALIVEGQIPEDLEVDRRSAGLFMVIGAIVFVLSLVPWWSRRRGTVHVQR